MMLDDAVGKNWPVIVQDRDRASMGKPALPQEATSNNQ
jgi:hypothetical protein